MSANHRFIKFWPQDWQRDPALRSCTLAARGLWIDLICIMHDGDPYGHLTINGKPASIRQIGTITGAGEKEAKKLLTELEDAGVFSLSDTGVIYSRRMVRDEARSEGGRQAIGKRWGNGHDPNSEPNRSPKRHPTREPTPQPNSLESEARSSTPLPPFDLEGVALRAGDGRPTVNGFYLDVAWNDVAMAARIDPERFRGDLKPLVGWLQADIEPSTIVAAVERVACRSGYAAPFTLAFFDGAVREQRRAA